MFTYYTLITVISWLALLTLTILTQENDRLNPEDKQLFRFTYYLIAASALAEWLGTWLNGREGLPVWLLLTAKCADYILTPMAGGTLVRQIRREGRWYRAMTIALAFNAVFQLIACPMGWTLTIDAQNRYSHGPLYFVYIAVYVLVILVLVIEFGAFGKTFRRENRRSLYAIMALIIVGIAAQEVLGSQYRTVYITLTIAAALMFIRTTEFSQLATDDFVAYQRMQLQEDPLTGVQSRFSYKQRLQEYDSAGALPADLAVYVIDINWLKEVNDTLGHDAGDELICATAKCVEKAFDGVGRCYRTGGDEFAVFANLDPERAEERMQACNREAQAWSGTRVKQLSISIGCAHVAKYPGLSCAELVMAADREMYAAKTEYYQRSGNDRRRRSD